MDRPEPPVGSVIYDEEGSPMRVIRFKDDIATLVYEGIKDRGFYRLMGISELGKALCEPYPPGTYDVEVEITARRVVRVSGEQLPALSLDMIENTDTPPIPFGEYMIYSMRPVRVVTASS